MAHFWDDWTLELLKVGGFPLTSNSRIFLGEWALSKPTTCNWNPLNDWLHLAGSVDCAAGGVQSYVSHTQGIDATVRTIKNGTFPHIVAALNSGNPFTYANPTGVSVDLRKWLTLAYADQYLRETAGAVATTPGGPGITPPGTPGPLGAHVFSGWADFRNSLSRHLPAQLEQSRRVTAATWRTVGARSRVKGGNR